jgi:hypothetical protein
MNESGVVFMGPGFVEGMVPINTPLYIAQTRRLLHGANKTAISWTFQILRKCKFPASVLHFFLKCGDWGKMGTTHLQGFDANRRRSNLGRPFEPCQISGTASPVATGHGGDG